LTPLETLKKIAEMDMSTWFGKKCHVCGWPLAGKFSVTGAKQLFGKLHAPDCPFRMAADAVEEARKVEVESVVYPVVWRSKDLTTIVLKEIDSPVAIGRFRIKKSGAYIKSVDGIDTAIEEARKISEEGE